MKAIIYEKYGSFDVFQLRELKKPTPNEGELLIKVCAVEVTKSDCELRSFNFAVKWFWLPLRFAMGMRKPKKSKQILGTYFAGEVESIGKNVSKFKKGDQIFGAARFRMGSYAQYVCLPAHYTLVEKPSNMSFEKAAAVPLGGLNALHFLRKANIQKGEKILINGAGGSIGTFAIQIAKVMGAEVTAVDHGIKEKMLRQTGADYFLDYTKEDFTQSKPFYDVIFNMVAKTPYSKCIKRLNAKGRYIMANPRLSDMIRAIFTSVLTPKKSIFAFAGETQEELLTLKKMIEEDKITSVIDKIYPLEQMDKAHQRVETENRLGHVVISSSS